MSTTASSVRQLKTRLTTSNSINNITTNGNDSKSNRNCFKKPISATNGLQSYVSSNGLKSHPLIANHHYHHHQTHQNGKHPMKRSLTHMDRSHSPPVIFHAIAPAPAWSSSLEELRRAHRETNGEPESIDKALSESSRRIAHVLARTQIKSMSTALSSCSDEEGESSVHRSNNQSSSVNTDEDESDDDESKPNNKPIPKSRRLQKTRKTSFTLANSNNPTPPTSKTVVRKDEQQSSSNDDEVNDLHVSSDDLTLNNRRLKSFPIKKHEHHLTTTTTTDDDTSKHHYHRYHPLLNLETNGKHLPTTSTCSSPVPSINSSANTFPVRKLNRFQVKSIRKSQQQQILMANISAAKSSNDDDCSVPNQRTKFPLKPALIERKHTNTPTTDGENPATNTDNIVNGAVSALKTVENGSGSDIGHHRVRFHVAQHKKHESAAEEEKLPAAAVVAPAPAPPSSAASAQGEDEEEEEAVAKSPDNRFIKYAKEIGRGAFKTVYRGLDTETSVAVAWCELQDFAQFDKHERARFKEEAEMLKKLKHQNIVRFYDFWEETNPRTNKKVIILVTELMTSGSLKGYIRNFKGQKEEKRINVMKKWCRQILKGLAYLHSRNPPVIHRDLKCDNVFISSTTGCVKIGDLGLATFKTQTFAKSMRGTMEFMAPEMFDEKYDELVDIYSFGLCMLEMMTGEYPYVECKGPTAVIKRVTAGLKPDCYHKVESEDVREVIDCCIRTKKEERLSVHDLLLHSFFLEDIGLRIDLVRDSSNESPVMVKSDSIDLKLKITDKTKRKVVCAEHKVSATVFEALLFPYNLKTDTPEKIADELIGKSYIFEDDKNFIIESIKDRLRAYQYEQLDRQAGVFCRGGKTVLNQTPQPSLAVQAQQQQQTTTTPLIAAPVAAPIPTVSTAPAPTVVQQTPVDQQQAQQMVKPSSEAPPAKPTVSTEPAPITQLPDLTTNIPGSAGSLEVLEAALKKTFTKNNVQQGALATVLNDPSETSSPVINPDDTSIPKTETNTATFEQTQPNGEVPIPVTNELPPSLQQQLTNSTISQTQSQPSTMLPNQQQQILQNSLLLPQPPQSFSYSAIPSTQHPVNGSSPNTEPIKPVNHPSIPPPPPAPSTSTTETIDNGHTSISPSPTPSSVTHLPESVQPSLAFDTPAQAPGSLQQLEVLLLNTFKKPGKNTGTAHSSDGEAANPSMSSISSSVTMVNNEEKTDLEPVSAESFASMTDEKKRQVIDAFNHSNSLSQQTPPLAESTRFEPTTGGENGNLQELESLLRGTFQKVSINEEPIGVSPQMSTSNDEIADLKSLILDLSRTLLTKMNVIETKIDDHCQQTRKINHMLTNTVLPSILDLTDIIQETSPSNLDGRVRTKLETIQTRIRTSQQQQQQQPSEMKDLMDI